MVVYNVIQSNQVVKGDQYHGQAEYQGKYCQAQRSSGKDGSGHLGKAGGRLP